MTKSKDMQGLSVEELREKLDESVKALYHLRVKTTTKELENTSEIPRTKRDIARLKQAISERERAAAATGSGN